MEQLLYTTLGGEGRSELTEKKSVFLGYAAPARTEAEAEAYIKKVRAEHPDARGACGVPSSACSAFSASQRF